MFDRRECRETVALIPWARTAFSKRRHPNGPAGVGLGHDAPTQVGKGIERT
jgi:hypothetical protein